MNWCNLVIRICRRYRIHRTTHRKEYRFFEDKQGLLVWGDDADIETWLKDNGLAANSRKVKGNALSIAGKGVQAVSKVMSGNGRWVKMTEDSAKLVSKYGSTGTGVIRNHGKIVAHVKFEDVSKIKSLANPQMMAGLAGVMTQMALEQAIEEITDYLKAIDKKIDDLLQDQKDQVVADLVGVAHMIDETMVIRDQVGLITETTWSKIAGCPQDVARAQGYALLKIEGLAKKLAEASDATEAETVANQLSKDLSDWISVLANAVQLQDKLSVVELDRVMVEEPSTVEQHRQGVIVARKQRLHDIETKLTQLNRSICQSADSVRQQKLLHPFAVDNTLRILETVNGQIAGFAIAIGIEADRVAIEMAPNWTDAAGKFINDSANQIGTGAKQLGCGVAAGASQLGQGVARIGGETSKTVASQAKHLTEGVAHIGDEARRQAGEGARQVKQVGAKAKQLGDGVAAGLNDVSKKLGGLFKR